MKYATYSTAADPAPRLGIVSTDRLIDVRDMGRDAGLDLPGTLLSLVQAPPEVQSQVRQLAARHAGASLPLDDIQWHAPIPRPGKNVFCMGLNYLAHARESGAARGKDPKVPTYPVLFTKAPTTVSGP